MKNLTLNDKMYFELKENLFEMNEGDFFSIRKCAMDHDVSYTPVRSAFLRLEKEGLLRKIPNVGYFVQKPDYEDFRCMYDVRKCIEPYVLREMFYDINESDISALDKIEKQYEATLNKCKWDDVLETDIEFHYFFVRKFGNRYLQDVYISARNRYKKRLIEMIHNSSIVELRNHGIDDHLALLGAIGNGNLNEAIAIVEKHIENGYVRMSKRGRKNLDKRGTTS